ncbi:uncharacterized protein LOC121418787 isoform X2 [Lytechinus variegatus]|uniref:uncharacterized protein LOC121418787 isoform X2 n=1 Tax=Lytechinus variegatus TaxID=7654 RepID=UPI001BB151A6|nr:uncharacterized protein LOC121418787 isoform X2 [Lytechinus variegatus]
MEGRGYLSEKLLVQLFLILGAFFNVALCTLQDEISSDSLEVRFDEIYDIDNWDQDMTVGFTSSVTASVNNYCMDSSNFASCQISAYNDPFTVVLSANSPEYFNGDIKMTFYVRIPEADRASDAAMEYVVPKATVATIVEENAADINNATGQALVFIGDKRIIALDTGLDKIMIPIVCVLFVLVVLLAVCLTCMQSRGEKKIQEQRQKQFGSKGDEGITLTAVKSGGYNSEDNNADTATTATTTKRFRRQKKLKEGREARAHTPVQVQPEVQSSANGTTTPIEVKPAKQLDNFSSNNSNDLFQQRGSRHAIELPPLVTSSTPRTMSLDGSDSDDKDRKKDKRKKKHHRKLSKQALVDAIDKDDDQGDDKSLATLSENNQGS